MAQAPLRKGDPVRVGRFRLSARLGSGAMGVVYLGTARDGTRAAVKVLRPELADDEEFRVRFRREVMTLSEVGGLCTVRVIEADTECERPFLATEYVEGRTLAEQIAATGPLDSDMLLGLAAGLAESLAAIHGAGIIHRDLKPSNVLLTAAGPKVIDFGIAQALDATAVTRTGMVAGSPGFMAPEQLTGQPGQQSDIFAWGLTVAFAATGRSPFGEGAADVIMYRIRHEDPDTSGIPEPLRALVGMALTKVPEERPTASDLLVSLAGEQNQEGVSADSLTQVLLARTWVLPVTGRSMHAQSARFRPRGRSRSRLALLVAAATVLVIAGGVSAAAALTNGHGSDTAGKAGTHVPVPAVTPSATAPVRAVRTSTPPSSGSRSAAAGPDQSSGTGPTSSASSFGSVGAGDVSAGALTCGFETNDGNVSVYVTAEHVADCSEISAALAALGTYWSPLSSATVTQDSSNGMLADVASVCHLSNSPGVVMSVYAISVDGQPAASDLGIRVCQDEEAKGWTPHASTQS